MLTLKEHVRDAQPDVVTLPQHFRNQGYFTARVGKIFHQGVPPEIGRDGLDDAASWDLAVNPAGVDIRVDEHIVTIAPPGHDRRAFGGMLSWLSLDSDEAHTDEIGAAEAVRILQAHHPHTTGQPLFLALGFYRPHTPYVAPPGFFDRYPPESIKLAEVPPGDRENKPVAALADRPFQADMTEALERGRQVRAVVRPSFLPTASFRWPSYGGSPFLTKQCNGASRLSWVNSLSPRGV